MPIREHARWQQQSTNTFEPQFLPRFIGPQRASRRRRRIRDLEMPPRLSCAPSRLTSAPRATGALRTCASRALSNYSELAFLSARSRVRLKPRGPCEKSFSPENCQRVSGHPLWKLGILALVAKVVQRAFHASSVSRKDPYQVLGVPKSASAADIKKAYFQVMAHSHFRPWVRLLTSVL